MSFGNENLVVLLGGIDITDRCISVPISPIKKPDWGQIPDLPDMQIEVINDDGFFSSFTPNSPIYNQQLSTIDVSIDRGFLQKWKGSIKGIRYNLQNKRATIDIENPFQRAFNKNSKAYFEDITPAQLAKNLLILHNVPIDTVSFARAQDILDDVPINVNLNPSALEWTGTLGDILQLCATAGIGRFFMTHDGLVGFETWIKDYSPPVAFTITDDDLLQWPEVESFVRERIAGYSIEYLFGTIKQTVAQTENTTTLQTLSFGPNSAVGLVDAGGATYIGEKNIEISIRDYWEFCFHVDHQKLFAANMNSGIRINSTVLGIDKVMAIEGMDWGDSKWAKLWGRFYVAY